MDYQAQAEAIYNPQIQAETSQAQNTFNNSTATINLEKSQVDPYYNNLLTKAQTGEVNKEASTALQYSTKLGGMTSGLEGNAMRILGTTYGQDVGQIQTERANKFADLAQRATNAQNTLDTTLGAIKSKYGGLIQDYVTSQQQAAAERAQQQAQFDAQMAATKASNGGSSSGSSSSSASSASSKAASANADQIFGLIHQIRNNPSTYHASWGQLADILKSQGFDTSHNSQADLALRRYFGQG